MRTPVGLTIATSVIAGIAGAASAHAPRPCPPPIDLSRCGAQPLGEDMPLVLQSTEQIDPQAFLRDLADRYRRLPSYEDRSRIVHVTNAGAADEQRSETHVHCAVDELGELQVEEATKSLFARLPMRIPLDVKQAIGTLRQRYELWLAPQLAFKVSSDPLEGLQRERGGTVEPRRVQPVRENERDLLRLELDQGRDTEALDDDRQVNVYVNPDSMLIERIESEEALPDGRRLQTTVEIEPHIALRDGEADEETAEAPLAAPPASRAAEDAPAPAARQVTGPTAPAEAAGGPDAVPASQRLAPRV